MKKFIEASYHFKYFNQSAVFVLVLIPQTFPGGLFNLIRLCSQEAMHLFTEGKTARRVSEQIQTCEQLSRDYYESVCNSMIDGQVTFSQLPVWEVGMGSASAQHFPRHRNHTGCSCQGLRVPNITFSFTFLLHRKTGLFRECKALCFLRKHAELVENHDVKLHTVVMEKPQPFNLKEGLKSLLTVCKI